MKHWSAILLLVFAAFNSVKAQSQNADIPQLVKNGKATQLVVDGKPFLIIGGELNNSSSSSMAYNNIWCGRITSFQTDYEGINCVVHFVYVFDFEN